jgi:hypothetical protein
VVSGRGSAVLARPLIAAARSNIQREVS